MEGMLYSDNFNKEDSLGIVGLGIQEYIFYFESFKGFLGCSCRQIAQ